MTRHWWVVELETRAGPWRLAVEALDITTASGEALTVDAGLVADLGPMAVGDDGLAVTATLPAEMLARPVELELLPCTVWRWQEDTVWDQAVPFARGRVRGLEYAHTTQPVQWSIVADVLGDSPMPDRSAAVQDGVTFPLDGAPSGTIVPDGHDGAVYPVIYGYPGYVSQQGSEQIEEVVPVTLAQQKAADFNDTLIMLCHEPLRAGTVDSSISLINRAVDPMQTYDQDWRIVQDNLGRSVTVCDFSRHNSHHPADDTPAGWYAGFSPAGGGGRYRDAYNVIVDVLRQWGTSIPVDWSAMAAAEGLLSRYNVDTWINAPTEPWKWLGDVLLPWLPVALREGPRGRYLAPMPTWATPTDARWVLDVDAGDGDRRSPVSVDSEGMINEITGRYWRNTAGNFRASRTLSAADGVLGGNIVFLGADSRILAHPLATRSQSLYGPRRGDTLDLDWTWDPVTVQQVLRDRLELYALPVETVRYYAHRATMAQGDVVLLTDSEIGASARVAIVQAAPLQEPDGQVVALRLIPLV